VVSWREEEARNEARFRVQNEWIHGVSASFGLDGPMVFVCECGDGSCTQLLELTEHEYQSVRSCSTHFALALNHENPETDHVVSESPRYAVVRKVDPFAVRFAQETDPRRFTTSGRVPAESGAIRSSQHGRD
jgi:hypothetical protein